MQPHAAMIATPPEVVDIVRAQLAGPDGSERITVQLDPPELGRVSIDFKFDAQQGLQHITVTGDSPEAVRQLRQLHFQLTQALEQHGLSSQDMTFRQNTSQQGQQPPGRLSGGPLSFAEDELATQTLTAASLSSRSRTIAAGLDIKL
jgi:flagellar hook-length control protein FliK